MAVGLTVSIVINYKTMAGMVPFIVLGGLIRLKTDNAKIKSTKASNENANQIVNESVQNIRNVAAFSAESYISKLYESELNK